MAPVRITVAKIGSLKHPVDLRSIERRPSKIMQISHRASIPLLGDAEGGDWSYTDEQLRRVVQHRADAGDVTLGLINAPLEDNYYLRRLDEHTVVLSLFEMAEIVRRENYTVEAFVVRIAYSLTAMFAATGHVDWASQNERWTHDDIRGCLFDMCSNKSDIVFSMHKPVLCSACRTQAERHQLDPQFLPRLDGELRKLRKTTYYRIGDLVKAYPIAALVITAGSGLALNILASIVFEILKRIWPSLG